MIEGIVWERQSDGKWLRQDNWPPAKRKCQMQLGTGKPFGDFLLQEAISKVEWTLINGVPKTDRYAILPIKGAEMTEETKTVLQQAADKKAARKQAEIAAPVALGAELESFGQAAPVPAPAPVPDPDPVPTPGDVPQPDDPAPSVPDTPPDPRAARAPRAVKVSSAERRAQLKSAGLCTACGKRPAAPKPEAKGGGTYPECETCRAYYQEKAKKKIVVATASPVS
jgi:hypothetical protein